LRVLITGGGGFIGTHLAHLFNGVRCTRSRSLTATHRKVWKCVARAFAIIRGELEDAVALAGALDSVDVVYHLAWSGIHSVSNKMSAGMPL